MTDETRPLSSRQELILCEVVSAYIAGGLPVGSKTLVESGAVTASSSTVRYELAELEGRGMLDHPHTSAGRVPTEGGYRYYAGLLLRSPLEPAPLPLDIASSHRELDQALRATAEALAQATSLLAAVSAPSRETAQVRHVELLRLQPQVVMAVVITSTGGIAKRLFAFDRPVDSGLVDWAGAYLAEMTVGLRLGSARLRERLADPSLAPAERVFLETLSPVFTDVEDDADLVVDGAAGMLDALAAGDAAAAGSVVLALEGRRQLLEVLRDALDAGRVSVRIGSELAAPELRPLALVSAGYGVANRTLGTVSLLGPTRMDYSGAIRAVRGASAALSAFVERVYDD